MSDDYTPVGMRLPDTQTMRDAYALYLTDGGADAPAAAAEFDRWLAAHDAEVAAKAVAPVLAIHHPDESHPARCIGCVDPLDEGWVYWPCPTVRALGVES